MFSGPGEREAFREVASKARMRRYGGDCYSYCLLAAGFIDLVIESSLQPYDIQPLIPIIEAAGGIVTSWSGGSPYDGGQIIAAGDREAAQNRARDPRARRAITEPPLSEPQRQRGRREVRGQRLSAVGRDNASFPTRREALSLLTT